MAQTTLERVDLESHERRAALANGPRVLAVCTLDLMAWVLLRPWLQALQDAGFRVEIACSRGRYFDPLSAEFVVHEIPLRRSFNVFRHLAPLWGIARLLRRERFDIINVHGPVAAAVTRVAACFVRGPLVINTVHGFYFHENMHPLLRRLFITIEWILGRVTDAFMFVSDEDRQTAERTGIAEGKPTVTLLNGCDVGQYCPRSAKPAETEELRRRHGILPSSTVVGIVGRVVREKGYREFLDMARAIGRKWPNTVFLVVGDSLPSDRDCYMPVFREKVRGAGIEGRFVFTGFVEDVSPYLRLMDIFVLPSYREGFPRSVVEAMSTGLPVVATSIRGCREAVAPGKTGFLIPPRDAGALTQAIDELLERPEMAAEMGAAGRIRAVELFDIELVKVRFVSGMRRLFLLHDGTRVRS